MANFNTNILVQQVEVQKDQLASSGGLPFSQLLSVEQVLSVLQQYRVNYRERIYTPDGYSLGPFLSQVIGGKETSCVDAVSRVLADRVINRQKACSIETTSDTPENQQAYPQSSNQKAGLGFPDFFALWCCFPLRQVLYLIM